MDMLLLRQDNVAVGFFLARGLVLIWRDQLELVVFESLRR
jgi:hypothetical protein